MEISKLTTTATSTEVSVEHLNNELFDAVKEGNLNKVKELIGKRANVNAINADWPRNTPMHVAAENGNVDIVKLLIEKGADFKASDNNGQTPFHWAPQGNLDVVKYLLEKIANVNAKETSLHLAANSKKWDVKEETEISAKDNYGKTLLH